jgi:HlyD family secretion protein
MGTARSLGVRLGRDSAPWLRGTAALAALAVLATLGTAQGCGTSGEPGEPTPLPPIAPTGDVVADAVVVPVQRAELSFQRPGRVARVRVAEGDAVAAGDELVRLDGADEAAAVLQAQADLAAAEADLEALRAGPSAAQVAAAEAGVAAAEASARSAGSAAAGAKASLDRIQAGATRNDVAAARRGVMAAENVLWGAQARRDSICGEAEKKRVPQAECDAAEAEVGRLYEELQIARLNYDQLLVGARPEEVAVARAELGRAGGQHEAAQADVRRAQAELERVRQGADVRAIEAASARADQARARLEAALVAMDRTVLLAPFAGVVASVDALEGASIAAGVVAVRVADPSGWQLITDDLTELSVVEVDVGDAVTIEIDALPDLDLEGKVERVSGFGEDRLGDVVYEAVIAPERHEPRLRWGMTASVIVRSGTR